MKKVPTDQWLLEGQERDSINAFGRLHQVAHNCPQRLTPPESRGINLAQNRIVCGRKSWSKLGPLPRELLQLTPIPIPHRTA